MTLPPLPVVYRPSFSFKDLKRTEHQKQIIVEVPETTVPIEYDLEEEVLGRIAYEEVLTAIQELPLIYRDILYLQCVEGYRLTEISKLILCVDDFSYILLSGDFPPEEIIKIANGVNILHK